MKYFVLLAIVYASIGSSEQGITKEQAIEMIKKVGEECAAKEGASIAEMTPLPLGQPLPSSRAGKCMHACIAESIGVMKDNKISVEGNVAIANMAFDDPAKIQTFTDVASECVSVMDADRCEAVVKIYGCCEKGFKSRGVSFDHW